MFPRFEQIAEKTWFLPRLNPSDDRQPVLGVIGFENQSILINAGYSTRYARHVMSGLAMVGLAPVDTLIYTHHHWTHIFGASAYGAEHIIAHRITQTIIANITKQQYQMPNEQLITHDDGREEWFKPPSTPLQASVATVIDDWRGFRIARPTITVSQRLDLHLENRLLRIEAIETPFVEGALIIGLPDADVAFIGHALMAESAEDEIPNTEAGYAIDVIEHLLNTPYQHFIDSTEGLITREQLEQRR